MVTLVLQGLLLPIVVRWARLPRDTAVEEERRLAETLVTEEALAELPQLAVNLGTGPLVVDRLRLEYEEHLHVLHTNGEDASDERDGTISNTPHCASHCLPASARPLSGSETSAALTTSCSARYRPGSTSKRYGSSEVRQSRNPSATVEKRIDVVGEQFGVLVEEAVPRVRIDP